MREFRPASRIWHELCISSPSERLWIAHYHHLHFQINHAKMNNNTSAGAEGKKISKQFGEHGKKPALKSNYRSILANNNKAVGATTISFDVALC